MRLASLCRTSAVIRGSLEDAGSVRRTERDLFGRSGTQRWTKHWRGEFHFTNRCYTSNSRNRITRIQRGRRESSTASARLSLCGRCCLGEPSIGKRQLFTDIAMAKTKIQIEKWLKCSTHVYFFVASSNVTSQSLSYLFIRSVSH